MDDLTRTSLWKQFGAAIDTLHDAVTLCPDELWTIQVWEDDEDSRYGQYWFIVGHTLRWLDIYLEGGSADYATPPPFMRNQLPPRPWTKGESITYLTALRKTCRGAIAHLTDEDAAKPGRWGVPFLELQLYNMRHVQEHAAQLQLVLGSHGVKEVDWIPAARDSADSR